MSEEKTDEESKPPLCWTVPLKGVKHTKHRTKPFQVMSSFSQAAPPKQILKLHPLIISNEPSSHQNKSTHSMYSVLRLHMLK